MTATEALDQARELRDTLCHLLTQLFATRHLATTLIAAEPRIAGVVHHLEAAAKEATAILDSYPPLPPPQYDEEVRCLFVEGDSVRQAIIGPTVQLEEQRPSTMTESEWRTCRDPRRMLKFLGERASERQLRLFVCGCCRAVWPQIQAQGLEAEVELAERVADGDATAEEALTAKERMYRLIWGGTAEEKARQGLGSCHSSRLTATYFLVKTSLSTDGGLRGLANLTVWSLTHHLTELDAAAILRDLFNPFRPDDAAECQTVFAGTR